LFAPSQTNLPTNSRVFAGKRSKPAGTAILPHNDASSKIEVPLRSRAGESTKHRLERPLLCRVETRAAGRSTAVTAWLRSWRSDVRKRSQATPPRDAYPPRTTTSEPEQALAHRSTCGPLVDQ